MGQTLSRLSRGRSPVAASLAALLSWLTLGATPIPESPRAFQSLNLADVTIRFPSGNSGFPIIVVPRGRRYPRREVLVRFLASGDDWAAVYLDGRLLFRANNTRRDQRVTLDEGAYHLEITGVSRLDVWDSGYLDLGRDNANIVVIRYGKNSGVRVSGDADTWIPD